MIIMLSSMDMNSIDFEEGVKKNANPAEIQRRLLDSSGKCPEGP
jgi:hypothetical protein